MEQIPHFARRGGVGSRDVATSRDNLFRHADRFDGVRQTEDDSEDRRRTKIPVVPDLQCAWQLLLLSANPRANHTARTIPPSSRGSAR